MLCLEVLSRFRAQVGIPVVPLTSLNSVIIWVIHCHPSFCRCFYNLRRKSLSLDLVFTIILPLDTDGFVFSTMSSLCGKFISIEVRRRHGAESLVGGVEDCRLSFLSPLSPGSFWISGRDPLLVVLYCNSPVFIKIKKIVFGVDCLVV